MGWMWTILLNGGLEIGAYWVSNFGLRQPSGWPRTLATALIAWGWLTIGMELLGSFGLLARGALLGWVGALFLIGLFCKLTAQRIERTTNDRTSTHSTSWEEIVVFGLILWATVLRLGVSLFRPVKVVSDGPIYHLFFAIRWWKAGQLELIAAPFGENAATYFPAVGDLWFCWLVIGFGGDFFAKVGQVPFLAIIGLTVMALAHRFGAGRPALLIATAWFLATPPLFLFAFEPNVDAIFVAGYLLSIYFFSRHALGDDGPASLGLGGLAAGCALATKAPGFVFVTPLLLLGACSAAMRGRTAVAKLGGILVLSLTASSVAGFWYVRNWMLTGNPLYPLHLEGWGRVWLAGWYGPDVMRASPYFMPMGNWMALVDICLSVFDPRLAPIWFAALAGAWAWRAGPRPPLDRWVWAASGLAVANVLLYWLLIPYRTQQRFMIQALGLAAIPLARTLDRSRSARVAAVALLMVHLFTPHAWPFGAGNPPWDLSEDVPNDLAGLILLPSPLVQTASVTFFAFGMASFAISWVVASATRCPTPRRILLATIGGLAFALLFIAAFYPWGMNSRRQFFPRFPALYQGWLELDSRAGPAGSRIAYAGTDLPYYLLGVDLRNEVRYVNVDAHPGWLLHDYQSAAIKDRSGPTTWNLPQAGWDRLHPDFSGWIANLRAERIQLLVVARSKPDWPRYGVDGSGFPIERLWAASHPESFELLYGGAKSDPNFRIYRFKSGNQ